ncbi:MAG: DNA methyltransferase [Mariniblastus sp.]
MPKPPKWTSQIHHSDCVEGMKNLPSGSIDLVFADPPFNIGFEYDVYEDKVDHQQYIDWSNNWISAVYQALKPDGTFWLAIGDEYAAELKIESQKIGFHCRSWVIWYYTFGVNCSKKFTRSHAHLFHFVKDPRKFTFRDEDLDNRVPSARELIYNDKRANPKGRLPDDTWMIPPAATQGHLLPESELFPHSDIVSEGQGEDIAIQPPTDADQTFALRPQELPNSFQPSEDTWHIPRVAGTFKERAGFHGCQMPEQLLGRIIRTCSNPTDIVMDPFSGSATTLAVAKKLGRQFVGFDMSQDYISQGRQRLETIRVGDRLNGSPEPLKSTFELKTKKSKRKNAEDARYRPTTEKAEERFSRVQVELTELGVIEAFRLTNEGCSADRVVADPDLNQAFIEACQKIGIVGSPSIWNTLLFRARKSGKLATVETTNVTAFGWDHLDKFMFASEIAWQQLVGQGLARSIDEILCDPELATQFDEIAGKFSPGHESLEYRWAALKLRKQAKTARTRAAILTAPRFKAMIPLKDVTKKTFGKEMGLYIVSESKTKRLYVGETLNLSSQLMSVKKNKKAWEAISKPLFVQAIPRDHSDAGNLAWQSCLVKKFKPRLNYQELGSA